MIRLLRWLFTGDGHAHKWEEYERYNVYNCDLNGKTDGTYFTRWILRCEHCGKLKKFNG